MANVFAGEQGEIHLNPFTFANPILKMICRLDARLMASLVELASQLPTTTYYARKHLLQYYT